MIDPATIAATSLTIGTEALAKPVEDLYTVAKGAAKAVIDRWRSRGKLDSIAQRLEQIEFVRTVFSQDPVRLTSFYYPSKVVESRANRTPRSVKTLNDIGPNLNILLSGTVGQGKSILMRYLCINEMRFGHRIPIFVELRSIDKTTTLQRLLLKQFEMYGFEGLTPELFEFLLEQGRLVFFLDGFDEVKREFALPVQQDLTGLINRFPGTRWVVSTRPGGLASHAASLPNLLAVEIAPLEPSDFDSFLEVLGVRNEHRRRLIGAIESSPSEIKGVLRTPLMLTLLNMTFGTSTDIPDTLHEFYESMFNFLLTRHDETKLAYVREKATHLSTSDLQDAFEHFCFLSKEYGVALSEEEFTRCAKDAAKVSGKTFTPDGFRTDLTETVCLMVRDGLKTAFIHKSIQEFFAAFFLKHLGAEATAKEIYQGLARSRCVSWAQELKFLEQIDRYRFLEHCRLPVVEEFLKSIEFVGSRKVNVSKAKFLKFVEDIDWHVAFVQAGAIKGHAIVVVNTSGKHFSAVLVEFARAAADMPAFLSGTEVERLKSERLERGINLIPFSKYLKDNSNEMRHYLSSLRSFALRISRDKARLERVLAERGRSLSEVLLRKGPTN